MIYQLLILHWVRIDLIFVFCLCVCIVVVFIYFQTPRHQKSWLLNITMTCCPAWDVLKAARMQFRQRLKELWNEFLTMKKKVWFLNNSMRCVFFAGSSWSWSYSSSIYNYLCNQCLSPLCCELESRSCRGILNTTLCDNICKWLSTDRSVVFSRYASFLYQ